MPEGQNEQENRKFMMLLSYTLPLFPSKHVTEARTEQLQRVKTSHKEHFTERDRGNIKYSASASLLVNVLSSLISHHEQQ